MRRATADTLPECLIHKILCFLSYEQATKMSILSKTDYSNKSQVNPHIDKWLDVALQNGVKDLDLTLSSYPFPIFTILAEKSLKELVRKFSDLRPVSLPSGVVNCNSLRKLSLSYVTLDKNVLETLLNSCPLIVTFILRNCWGLIKIELLNLQKIKSVSIGTIGENQRIKIRAPNLEHLSYTGRLLEGLDVVECQNLKSLELSCVYISDGFLQHLISRSQFLESLVLANVSERVLGRFNICKSRSLKMLKLWNCDDITKIDATNLVSIEYAGFQIPELKLGRESSQLKHSKIVLHCHDYLNAAWFGKLREFLSNSTSWSQVSLHFRCCSRINMNDWQLHHGVATPQVGVLNVYSTWQNEEFPPFMDALLWTCHPKRLNLQLHSTREKNGVKYLVFRVPRFLLPTFTILAEKLVLERCNLMPVSLSSGFVSCNSLRKLSLSDVTLDDNMLQTLLNSCPLIVSFILKWCWGLEKIELLNLRKIKSVSIKALPTHHLKIQAPTLEHIPYFGLSEGLAVKSLELSYVYISAELLQNIISRSQLLESLIFDGGSAGWGRFNICKSESLKILKLRNCRGIKEIDAPNLV
ncbi:hypothetical protein CQW23_22667 [Capsicum baccatum]|uniref:At1g61320/AtMIF1 LRR domain-containing protein n=1 Tax=Capsicum baccatum TaxID=33114 RepID=A0A2G2W1J2_CAPBA|nr:hypothetical protein CQW23_22667 [Capsicum baccatum]